MSTKGYYIIREGKVIETLQGTKSRGTLNKHRAKGEIVKRIKHSNKK